MGGTSADRILIECDTDADIEGEPPARPQIIPELLLARDGAAGFLIVGGRSRSFVRGVHAGHLLPRLWPLLDGTRSTDELAAALEVSTGAVARTLALLHRAGFLEDSPCASTPPPMTDTASMLGRLAAAYGKYQNRGSALRALSEHTVGILAEPEQYRLIAAQLLATGISKVIDLTASAPMPRVSFALVMSGGAAATEAWRKSLAELREVRTLFGSTRAESFAIGPLYIPQASACLACCKSASDNALPPGEFQVFSTAIVSHALLSLLGGIHASPPFGRIDLAVCDQGNWSNELHAVPRTPGCMECGLGSHASLDHRSRKTG